MRYVGAMFDPRKVAYDGARLAPAVPIAARALTPAVAEAMAPIVPAREGTATFERPEPGEVSGPMPTPVVVAETPAGRPVAMVPVRDEAAPVYDYGPAPVPINDRPVNGPPRARDAAPFLVEHPEARTPLIIGAGVALLLAGVALYYAGRR